VKIPAFSYHRPESLDDALGLLRDHGEDAKVLAGGQSLLPIMALRLGRPEHLIDISRLPGLDTITVDGRGEVVIGALVRHAAAESSIDVARHAPLVSEALPHVGHTAIRTRGTVCGSIAHADPAAELPAVALATNAVMVTRSSDGVREIAASDFFEGYLQTALRPDELLTEVRFPQWPDNTGAAVSEVSRRHGDFAMMGLACMISVADGITAAALSFFGADSVPIRATEAEQSLVGRPPDRAAFNDAAEIVMSTLQTGADLHASAAHRRHLAGVVTRRALAEASSRIGAMT